MIDSKIKRVKKTQLRSETLKKFRSDCVYEHTVVRWDSNSPTDEYEYKYLLFFEGHSNEESIDFVIIAAFSDPLELMNYASVHFPGGKLLKNFEFKRDKNEISSLKFIPKEDLPLYLWMPSQGPEFKELLENIKLE